MAQIEVAAGTGPPTRGRHRLDDTAIDNAGTIWRCTVPGRPGTWVQVGGDPGASGVVVTANEDYSASAGDIVLVQSGGVTITLPTPATGAVVSVKALASGVTTIVSVDAENVDGAANVTLNVVNESVTLVGDGTSWWAVPSRAPAAVRWARAVISFMPQDFSLPEVSFPVVAGGRATVVTPPIVVGADGSFGRVVVTAPTDADMTVSYVEFTVTNQDGTEVLSLGTGDDVVLTAGDAHTFDATELSDAIATTGSDLTMLSSGSIKSTAGGVFTAQVVIELPG